MMLSNTPAMKRLRGDKGFTLVELLVVIVIIGILVAIAVPIFLNQREAAQKRAVESDVRNAIPVMETIYAEEGEYKSFTVQEIAASDLFAVSDDVTMSITVNTNDQAYKITAGHSALEGDGAVVYDSEAGGSVSWDNEEEGPTGGAE